MREGGREGRGRDEERDEEEREGGMKKGARKKKEGERNNQACITPPNHFLTKTFYVSFYSREVETGS